jgi:hypothetical protein
MNNDDPGKIIYQTPDNIFQFNRKRDLEGLYYTTFMGVTTIILIIILIFLLILKNPFSLFNLLFFLLLCFIIFIFVVSICNSLFYARLYKLKIYKKGFSLPTFDINGFFKRERTIVYFDSIVKIEFISEGVSATLTTKDDTTLSIGKKWDDKDFIELVNLIITRVPSIKIIGKTDIKKINEIINQKRHQEA